MRVIIADDEVIVRIGLKSLIDWEKFGHEVIGEAENGEEAYSQIIKYKPDLVITDIKMPITDGIELIKKTKEFDPDIKIIVLSGYGDYKLVRDALKLGAEDYLLKLDINPNKLIELLTQLEKNKTQKNPENIIKPLGEQLSVLRESFLKNVISDKIKSNSEFLDRIKTLKFKFNKEKIYCMIFRIREYNKFVNTNEAELIVLIKSIKALVLENIKDTYSGYCIEIKTGEFCIFYSADTSNIPDSENTEFAQSIMEMIKKYLNFTVITGISSGETDIEGIKKAFSLALKANELAKKTPEKPSFLWKDIDNNPDSEKEKTDFSVLKYKKELFHALAGHNRTQISNIFDNIKSSIADKKITPENFSRVSSEIIFMLQEYFEKYEINLKFVLKESYMRFNELKYLENREQIYLWLKQVYSDLSNYLDKDTSLHPKIIEKAKEYIIQNSKEQLSLNKIAGYIHLNPNYFCSLFKKYEGIGCIDFLNRTRIENAKNLLKENNLKIYEIAYKIGFQNINYFNRLFKKYTGYTPSEYSELNFV